MRAPRWRRLAGAILTLAWLGGGPGLTVVEAAVHAQRAAGHTALPHVETGDTAAHADHCALSHLGPTSQPQAPVVHRVSAAPVRLSHVGRGSDLDLKADAARLPPSRAPPVTFPVLA